MATHPNSSSLRDHRLLELGSFGVGNQVDDCHPSHSRDELVSKPLRAAVASRRQSQGTHGRKAVNSWIAFRGSYHATQWLYVLIRLAYYSRGLHSIPQRRRSSILASMWKHDVHRHLWELISITFSHIRDQHTEDCVSLDRFLDVVIGVIPVIPSRIYLEERGCHRIGTVCRKSNIKRVQNQNTTMASCAELAYLCYQKGVISRRPVWADETNTVHQIGQIPGLITLFPNPKSRTCIQVLQSTTPIHHKAVNDQKSRTETNSLLLGDGNSQDFDPLGLDSSTETTRLTMVRISDDDIWYPFSEMIPVFPHIGVSTLFNDIEDICNLN